MHIAARRTGRRAGFLHVPSLPGRIMTLEDIVRGIRIVLEVTATTVKPHRQGR